MRRILSKFFLIYTLILFLSSIFKCYAGQYYITVEKSKISLSFSDLSNSSYLTSQPIKKYLIDCIQKSHCFNEHLKQEIFKKKDHISLFCFKNYMYDDKHRAIIRIWIPEDILKPISTGELHNLFLTYAYDNTYEKV